MANGLFNLKQVMQGIQQGGWNGQKPPAVEYLVVAGGGGGARGSGRTHGGGGGAGGLLTGLDPVPNGQTLLVTIGTGGTGGSSATSGTSSVFGSISTSGGGYGGLFSASGASGGSGGGGFSGVAGGPAGQGTANQGNAGGVGFAGNAYGAGGGGGAGTVGIAGSGSSGGNGGSGIASAITGTVTAYAGGGGGSFNGTAVGAGGVGGGGAGGNNSASNPGVNGTANTGGGGGGYGTSGSGGNGGSGIVVVSYPDIYAAPTATTGSPTVSTSGSGSIGGVTTSTNWGFYTSTNTSNFAFGTNSFTIEFWIYLHSINTSGAIIYDGRPASTSGAYPTIYHNGSGVLNYYTNTADAITGSTLSTGTWYHIAVSRASGNTRMFVNGTQVGSTYADTNTYLSGPAYFGANSYDVNSTNYVKGNMSNVRVNNTTGLYTSTFTPSTSPLTVVSGTILLLNSNSGSYLVDSSGTNTVMANAYSTSPVWNALSPFSVTGYKNRVYTWTSSGSITF
jgi:hypothetical protein